MEGGGNSNCTVDFVTMSRALEGQHCHGGSGKQLRLFSNRCCIAYFAIHCLNIKSSSLMKYLSVTTHYKQEVKEEGTKKKKRIQITGLLLSLKATVAK